MQQHWNYLDKYYFVKNVATVLRWKPSREASLLLLQSPQKAKTVSLGRITTELNLTTIFWRARQERLEIDQHCSDRIQHREGANYFLNTSHLHKQCKVHILYHQNENSLNRVIQTSTCCWRWVDIAGSHFLPLQPAPAFSTQESGSPWRWQLRRAEMY